MPVYYEEEKKQNLPCTICKNREICKFYEDFRDAVSDINCTIHDFKLDNIVVMEMTCKHWREDKTK